jgi:hypothetical protein
MRSSKPIPWTWPALVAATAALAAFKLAWGGDVDAPPFTKWWQWLDPVLSLATFGAAAAVWWEERNERRYREQSVQIVITCAAANGRLALPYQPLRQHLSRAELTGVFSMYSGPSRIDPTVWCKVIEPGASGPSALDQVISGHASELVIEVPEPLFHEMRQRANRNLPSPDPVSALPLSPP